MKANLLSKVWCVVLGMTACTFGCKKAEMLSGSSSTSMEERAATSSIQSVKVATYNAHLFLLIAPKEDEERKKGIQQFLLSSDNHNDVVFFQEIWKDVTKNELIEGVKSVYPYSYHTNSVGTTIGDGLLVLSKFPITDNKFVMYKDAAGWDYFSPKGFLKTRFSTPNGDFYAFSTHTNSEDKFKSIREKQFKQIKSEMSDLNGVPSILLGDLNVIGESDEYNKMMSVFSNYADSYRKVYPDAGTQPGYTFDNAENKLTDYFYPHKDGAYKERLDYVLVSEDGWDVKAANVSKKPTYNSASLGASTATSDHYMYETSLVLTRKEVAKNPYVLDNYNAAVAKINELKRNYGTGLTAKIIIYNNTGKDLLFDNKTMWYNSSFYSVPPAVIPAGKYGVTLASHDTGEATGVFNQLSYVVDGQKFSFGTYVPWAYGRTNNVLVDFKEITEDELYKNSTRPSISKEKNGFKITGTTATGDSPLINFSVEAL